MKPLQIGLNLLILLLFSSCAVNYRPMPPIEFNEPVSFRINRQDSLEYSIYKDILDLSGNKRLAGWARRHKLQIVGVEVVNLSGEFRKGFQLKYYEWHKRITSFNVNWFAKKSRQKVTAAPFVAIPFMLMEAAVDRSIERGINNGIQKAFDTPVYLDFQSNVTGTVTSVENRIRKHESRKLKSDLKSLDISRKILHTGKPVYGIVILNNDICVREITVEID